MGSYDEQAWRKGPWTPQEDKLLIQYISHNGEGRWSSVSKFTGLNRSGKSCRLRWVNYLRPGLKKGHLTPQEEGIIIELHALWGNKWSTIARYLPGRTDNEIKNYWRTHFKTSKSSEVKQGKRKTLIRKQQQQQQQQQQGFITDHSKINIIDEALQAPNHDEKNSKREVEIPFPTIDNHRLLPMVLNQESASDSIPFDCYLWGGLWNMDDDDDDPNACSKRFAVDQKQSNIGSCYYSVEGDAVDYMQNGGFIF